MAIRQGMNRRFITLTTIYLEFDFLNRKPISFTAPVAIISTTDIEDIPHLIEQMEEWRNRGYYLAGYISYEAAPAFDSKYKVHHAPNIPLLWFGVFKEPSSINKTATATGYSISIWQPQTTKQQFIHSIEKIQQMIREGTTKQVNYTTRFLADFKGDAYSYYNQLQQNQSASYRAFLQMNETKILSLSPELFFKLDGRNITTRPMKGTMRRGYTYKEDQELKQALYHSTKNRDENRMIANLLKQELATISEKDTAKITKQFEIETHPTIHQMTSTVTAELRKDCSMFDWFQALFPCSSVTGEPKVETMEIINQLETTARDVYCGAIGYITPNDEAIFNVPIRTVLIQDNIATYGSGSGIAAKSDAIEEYQEVIEKTKVITRETKPVSLLESMRLEKGEIPYLNQHLTRLKNSAAYFQIPYDQASIQYKIKQWITSLNPKATYKIRLVLHSNGEIDLDAEKLQHINEIYAVLAPFPIEKDNVFLYHKTTNRSIYKQFDQSLPKDYHTTLLWNEEGNITEFTIGNVVIEMNGKLYTPPVSDGLLAGVMRNHLLAENRLIEKHIRLQELKDAEQIYFINSVRGWIKVCLKEQESSLTRPHLLQ